MEKEIIDKLVSQRNIFTLIELSKKFTDINLEDYFHLIPSININYSNPLDNDSAGYKSHSIDYIHSFKLKNENIHYFSKSFFLQNILNISEFTVFDTICKVKDGEYFSSSEDFSSIEFSLHSTTGFAIYDKSGVDNSYCLERILLNKEQFKGIIREVKLNKITDTKSKTIKELVDELEEKTQSDFIEKEREEYRKKHPEYINLTINYKPYPSNFC